MGRKIPGKKHRGVKDPRKQQFEKKQKLKSVINAPPSNPNVQEIPKTVIELNRLREIAKSAPGKVHKRKRRKRKLLDTGQFSSVGPKLAGVVNKESYIPRLKQKPGESDEAFLWRLEVATHEIINEAQMEVKHDVVVSRDTSGKVIDVKPGKPADVQIRPNEKTNKKKKKKSESSKAKPNGVLNSKLERLKEKKELKQILKKVKVTKDDEENKKDYVKFGEVAHQPPQFSTRPRGSDLSSCDRPGRKNLLLTNLLGGKGDSQSMSDKKQIASAREEAMRVYKLMKNKNKGPRHSRF